MSSRRRGGALLAATGLLVAGCASVPTGPSVMVLPGTGRPFEQFQADDGSCRDWAARQAGAPGQAATNSAVSGAVVGTLVGAAAGAALGAAAGNPGVGAAAGAGVGLLGGTAVGASAATPAYGSAQRRYDAAYMQCMYARGHQIPVRRGAVGRTAAAPVPAAPPPVPAAPPADIPPPPAGAPPPPPGPVR